MLLLFTCHCSGETITTCLDFAPYEVNGEGKKQWNGPNIETLYYVTQGASLQLDTSLHAPFARCLELLKSGQIDILPGLIYTEERAKTLILLPYALRHELAIFYLAKNSRPFSLQALTGEEVIGVHRVFAIPDSIKNHPVSKQLIPVSSVDIALQMLLKGRLDGVLSTITTGETVMEDVEYFKDKFHYMPLSIGSDMHICFGISKLSPLAHRLSLIQSAIHSVATNPDLSHLRVVPSAQFFQSTFDEK